MITYHPSDLKKRVLNLIDKLPFLTWDIEDVESFNITNEVYADYDFIITEDSDVCLYSILLYSSLDNGEKPSNYQNHRKDE